MYPDTPSMLLRWLLQHGPLRGLLLQGLEALSMAREGERRGLQRFQAMLQVGGGAWGRRLMGAAPCMRHAWACVLGVVQNGAPH